MKLETLAALTGPLRVGDDEGSVTVSDEWLILLRGAYTDEEPDRRYVARVDAAADLAVASLALVAEVRRLRERCSALEAVVAALPQCTVDGCDALATTLDETDGDERCDAHMTDAPWVLEYAAALRALEVTP